MRAFSLVELSIVLVILGLLAGGILAGQSLIRAAELRSATSQAQQYLSAFWNFRDKYMASPGDTSSATRFWGSAGGNGGDNTCWAAQTQSSPASCNGNGDGVVTSGQSVGQIRENFMAWKHVANAGLIEGTYLGRSNTSTASGACSAPSIDCPQVKLSNSMLNIYYDSIRLRNHFIIETAANAVIVRPEELWNIDSKLDDGKPHTGRVFSYGEAGCATSDDPTVLDASYNLTNTAIACKIRLAVF